MSKVVDMTGQHFGRLVVLERGENDRFGKAQWWCQCDCGNKKLINGASLRKGLTVSCGCRSKEAKQEYNDSKVVNEIGNIYGYLTVIERAKDVDPKDGRAQWICECQCGNKIITTGRLLRRGHKMSCGCLKKSKGELKVEQLLLENKIDFSEQYSVYIKQEYYENNNRPYFFDFAVMEDEKVKYFIEYDGQQHFSYVTWSGTWNTKENLEKTKIRDSIKNEYCLTHNIPLIRIPYTHYDNLCIEDLKLETTNFLVK